MWFFDRRERELVAEDESAGFVVADKAKHLAKVAARNQKNRPKRPRSKYFSQFFIYQPLHFYYNFILPTGLLQIISGT